MPVLIPIYLDLSEEPQKIDLIDFGLSGEINS